MTASSARPGDGGRYDIVICGAGVAGLTLARLLGDEGRRVLVLERDRAFRDVFKGEVLQPRALRILQAVGSLGALREHGALRADRFTAYSPDGRPVGDLPYAGLPGHHNHMLVHGFRDIVFLGDHGGYQNDLRRVVAELNKAWAQTKARAFVPPAYYETSSTGFAQILRQHGFHDDEIGTHAGLADTSLQLAVAPQMVRLDVLQHAVKPGAIDGVYDGDPRRSSVQLGKLGTDTIVSRTVAAIRRDTDGH